MWQAKAVASETDRRVSGGQASTSSTDVEEVDYVVVGSGIGGLKSSHYIDSLGRFGKIHRFFLKSSGFCFLGPLSKTL